MRRLRLLLPILCLCAMAAATTAETPPATAPMGGAPPAAPRRQEGPFDPALCSERGVSLSRCEWVINPYQPAYESTEKTALRDQLRQRKIAIDLVEVPLQDAIKHIAMVTATNLILHPSIANGGAFVSLSVHDVPAYDVLGYIAEICDITFRIDNHAVMIGNRH